MLTRIVQREFDRIVKVCKNDNVPFPSKAACEKKYKEMKALEKKPLTEVLHILPSSTVLALMIA